MPACARPRCLRQGDARREGRPRGGHSRPPPGTRMFGSRRRARATGSERARGEGRLGRDRQGRARRVGAHGPARKAARTGRRAERPRRLARRQPPRSPRRWRRGRGSSPPPPWTAGGRSPRSSRRSRIPFRRSPRRAARDGRCCSWSCMPPARRVAAHPAQPAPRRGARQRGGVTPPHLPPLRGRDPQATSCSRAIFA